MTGPIRDKDLTHDQRRALLHIKRHKNVFITGGAGSGKSTIIEMAVRSLEAEGRRVAVCAPTGRAALNIGGVTVHSLFGFKAEPCIHLENNRLSLLAKAPPLVKGIDSLLIDEASMLRIDMLDSIMLSLSKAEQETGKKIQLILLGDMLQIPPVMTDQDRSVLEAFYGKGFESGYPFEGLYWQQSGLYNIVLHDIVRQKDPAFIDCLNRIRVGDVSALEYLNQHVTIGTPREDAVWLFAHNRYAEQENRKRLAALNGSPVIYPAELCFEEGFSPDNIDRQILKAVPSSLALKEGARVMFTANDYPGNHAASLLYESRRYRDQWIPLYVNGMTGTVHEVGKKNSVIVRTDRGKTIDLGPVSRPLYSYVIQDGLLTKKKAATCRYIPLTLAYSITFHRSQGQTMDAVHVTPETFGPGQAYVGLSRVTSLDGLSLARRMRPEDLQVSPAALAFCASLEKGRPCSGPRKDRMLWVPEPLLEHVRREISLGQEIPLPVPPPMEKGRHHVRVPSSLSAHIEEEIRKWKEDIRKEKAHAGQFS